MRLLRHRASSSHPPTPVLYTLDDDVCYDIGVLDIGDEPAVIDVDSNASAR